MTNTDCAPKLVKLIVSRSSFDGRCRTRFLYHVMRKLMCIYTLFHLSDSMLFSRDIELIQERK